MKIGCNAQFGKLSECDTCEKRFVCGTERLNRLEGNRDRRVEAKDDLMTMEKWLAAVKSGAFIDYDGMGDYSDGTNIIKIDNDGIWDWIYPSDVEKGTIDLRWSHVVWYNK